MTAWWEEGGPKGFPVAMETKMPNAALRRLCGKDGGGEKNNQTARLDVCDSADSEGEPSSLLLTVMQQLNRPVLPVMDI